MFGRSEEPTVADIASQRRPSNVEAVQNERRKSVSNKGLTGASALTVRQSILPIVLVTSLFFMWGFAVSEVINETL
jgi:FHS family L-fucose permease-like MFS transporter